MVPPAAALMEYHLVVLSQNVAETEVTDLVEICWDGICQNESLGKESKEPKESKSSAPEAPTASYFIFLFTVFIEAFLLFFLPVLIYIWPVFHLLHVIKSLE